MTRLQSFDNAFSWATVDPANGSVRKLGALRSASVAARRPRSNGWFSDRTGTMLAFGVWQGRLNAWVGERRFPVPGTDATLTVDGRQARLSLQETGGESVTHEFEVASAPAVSRIDPTFDEAAEDNDFAIWLASTMSNPDRIEHLQSELSPAVEVAR